MSFLIQTVIYLIKSCLDVTTRVVIFVSKANVKEILISLLNGSVILLLLLLTMVVIVIAEHLIQIVMMLTMVHFLGVTMKKSV